MRLLCESNSPVIYLLFTAIIKKPPIKGGIYEIRLRLKKPSFPNTGGAVVSRYTLTGYPP
jgi:hypothetical protein